MKKQVKCERCGKTIKSGELWGRWTAKSGESKHLCMACGLTHGFTPDGQVMQRELDMAGY